MNDEKRQNAEQDTVFDRDEEIYNMANSLSKKVAALKKKQLDEFNKLKEVKE